jgi:hypothetical protein
MSTLTLKLSSFRWLLPDAAFDRIGKLIMKL